VSYTPLSGDTLQYLQDNVAASGYYIKLYASGTTTPISMATDSTGGTLLAKAEVNSQGRVINGSSAVFIPHIDQTYKLVLYPNATDADANTFANAIYEIDLIPQAADNLATTMIYNQGGTGATDRTIESRLQDYVSIIDYGADPTGIVDATTAIQAALDAYDRVYVPPGDFLISSTLSINTDNTFYGAGKFISRIFCAEDANINLVQAATISSSSGQYDENITISDMTLDHNRVAAMTAELYMTLLLIGTRTVTVENVHFKNPNTDGIYINFEYGGTGHADNQPRDITINKVRMTGNNVNRNGISVISLIVIFSSY